MIADIPQGNLPPADLEESSRRLGLAMTGDCVKENKMLLTKRRRAGLLLGLILAVSMSGPTACSVSRTQAKETSADAANAYKTRTGKTIIITETHPVGQSLSTIEIGTKDFEHNFQEKYEDRDPISDVFVADIDGNGFDEIYIITTSAGSGSHGSVMGFASNRDKSLSTIQFPEIEERDIHFKGYMGHDTFKIAGQKLLRIFPIYNQGDTNHQPTGGTRKLVYGLYPGEGMWQLKVEKSETLNSP